MSLYRSQLRLQAITSSLPNSSGSALTTLNSQDFSTTVNALASSIRRINSFDDASGQFYDSPAVFKSMGSENRFVILNNQKLFVSSSTLLSGTTEISTSAANLSITGPNGVTTSVDGAIALTGSKLDVKASSGNVNIASTGGSSFVENGTEVFSINSSRKSKFHQNAGSLASPDVEFDGKVRFDELVATSGSSIDFSKGADQKLSKSNSGNLILSNSVGGIYFADSSLGSSNWSDKDKGLPFALSAADWNKLVTNGVTSILGALVASTTAQKSTAVLSTALAAGSATSMNLNFSTMSTADLPKRVDVFVNGQLLLSGTVANVQSNVADYYLDLSGGLSDVEIKFGSDLESDDVIAVTVR